MLAVLLLLNFCIAVPYSTMFTALLICMLKKLFFTGIFALITIV